MEFEKLKKELKEYQQSTELETDCTNIKNYYATFCEGEEMPTDLEIEEEAINEKRIYFEAVNNCTNGIHEWQKADDELDKINGKYKYCRICGKTEMTN